MTTRQERHARGHWRGSLYHRQHHDRAAQTVSDYGGIHQWADHFWRSGSIGFSYSKGRQACLEWYNVSKAHPVPPISEGHTHVCSQSTLSA